MSIVTMLWNKIRIKSIQEIEGKAFGLTELELECQKLGQHCPALDIKPELVQKILDDIRKGAVFDAVGNIRYDIKPDEVFCKQSSQLRLNTYVADAYKSNPVHVYRTYWREANGNRVSYMSPKTSRKITGLLLDTIDDGGKAKMEWETWMDTVERGKG